MFSVGIIGGGFKFVEVIIENFVKSVILFGVGFIVGFIGFLVIF